MLRKIFLIITLALLLSYIPQPAQSQGVLREGLTLSSGFGVGARAMGMGGAHIAAASDASAMYWNPAGLVFIRRIELASTVSREDHEIDTNYFGTSSTGTEKHTRLNSLALAYPIPTLRGSLVLGLAVNRVHSFDRVYKHEGYNSVIEEDEEGYILSGLSYEKETETSKGNLYTWAFTGAMDVSEQLSLGIALNIWDGSYEGLYQLDDRDIEDEWWFDTEETVQHDNFDLDGFNISVGGIYHATRHLNFGFSVNSKVNIEFDGDQLEEFTRTCDDGASEDDCTPGYSSEYYFYEDREIPWAFNLGVAYTQKMFKIAFDLNYMDWSESDELDLDEETLYDEVLRIRLGGEAIVPNWPVRLRAGIFTDPLPYQGTEIDKDRMYYTGGIGFLLDRVFSVDIAYVTGSWEQYDTTYEYRAETTSNRIFLTGGYHF